VLAEAEGKRQAAINSLTLRALQNQRCRTLGNDAE
jgi:hypothetical protein